MPSNLPYFIKYGYDILKFVGFNAEGRPKYLCPICYEKLGKPESYSLFYPKSCRGHDVGGSTIFCFVCAEFLSHCYSCGGFRGGNLRTIYSLKN